MIAFLHGTVVCEGVRQLPAERHRYTLVCNELPDLGVIAKDGNTISNPQFSHLQPPRAGPGGLPVGVRLGGELVVISAEANAALKLTAVTFRMAAVFVVQAGFVVFPRRAAVAAADQIRVGGHRASFGYRAYCAIIASNARPSISTPKSSQYLT